MNHYLFIRNPYLAIVISIVLTMCGTIALLNMPVAQYPSVTPPQVTVNVVYPGADAMTLIRSVIEPLEQQINGAPGILYINSTGADSGQAVITITFALGTDPDKNRQNVQDRVNWALPQLPQAVQREGVIVRSQTGNILLAISLFSPGEVYDELFMSNYGAIHMQNTLERINGVAQVQLFGAGDYAMRIWLDDAKLASLNMSVQSVLQALQQQNVQVSSGSVGSAPAPDRQRFAYDVRVRGRLSTVREFGDIIVRSSGQGAEVHLRDVAAIELGNETYSSRCTINGKPAVIFTVFQESGANGIAISDECHRLMDHFAKSFPPELAYEIQYDSTRFVREGIRNVVHTLILAVALVALVTLIFLQDWRMALIPVLAIPVSVAGTFVPLYFFGFSINMVTLFALILAIGIVVDDAIIVIENVSRLMEQENLSPVDAAEKSMKEITGAIIATTAVLLAMFVPVCFFPGITGELYRVFGVTISLAVLISAVNALSLSPALSSLLLKPREKAPDFWIFRRFNQGFSVAADGVNHSLKTMLRHKLIVLSAYFLLAAAAVWGYTKLSPAFIPEEDQGYFFGSLQLPSASALGQTSGDAARISAMVRSLPGVATVIAIPGFNLLNSTPAERNAALIVVLEPWTKRAKDHLTSNKIMEQAQYLSFQAVPAGFTMFFAPPPIPGIGMAGGFNFVIEERSATDPARLAKVLDEMLLLASRRPELSGVFSAYGDSTPEIELEIDRAKALALGVSMQSVDGALENLLGFTFVNLFNRFGQVYKVEVQSNFKGRANAQDILNLYVPNAQGEPVPMASIGVLRSRLGAGYLTRYNLRLAAQLQGSPGEGFSSGEAMNVLESLASKVLPGDMTYEWTDMSFQEAQAGHRGPWILLLALTFIFLFLMALYQSLLLPFSVLTTVFLSLGGAVLLLIAGGISDNIYTQIGVVLLFAMACKSAILVADFAQQKAQSGMQSDEAAREASRLRFRAVTMTVLAFVFGTLPLAFATGPGSASQRSIGFAVLGGMIGAFVGAIWLCPIWFARLTRIVEKGKKVTGWLIFLGLLPLLNSCYAPPPRGSLVEAVSMKESENKANLRSLPPDMSILTKDSAVTIALENNPDYLSAYSAINGARMRYYQAIGAYSPTFSTGVAVGQQLYRGSGWVTGGSAEPNTAYTYAMVQANWILFDGLRREFELLAASRSVKLEELLSDNAKRILCQSVLVAYDEIIAASAQKKIAEADLTFQSEELHQAEVRMRYGDVPIGDVLNFRARRQRAEMAAVKAANRWELARFSLAKLMGLSDSALSATIRFSEVHYENRSGESPIADVGFYLDQALAKRPDLNAIREGLQIGRYHYYQTLSAYSPTISAYANYSYSSASTLNSGNNPGGFGNFALSGNSFNYGGIASWNIFDGFIRYNTVRAARAQLDQAYLKASGEWIGVVNEVRSAHTDCRYLLELLRIAEKQWETLRQERDIIRRSYQVGEVPIIRLNQVQEDFVRSEYEWLEAKVALEKARIRLLTAAAMQQSILPAAQNPKPAD